MEKFYIVVFCLMVATGIDFATACNGYKARLVKMENCGGDDQVMKIDPNVTLSMNKACELILVGCAETTGFATAEIKYTILKNGNRITSGTTDMCAELKKNARGLTSALVSFGLPNECPVPKMRKCSDGSQKISLVKQKSFLSLIAGNIDISIEGKCDSGNLCMHMSLNVSR